ncbi:hypothetical protein BCR35DRAFT_351924 [Leucosporidium creatinivorum]|uniref:RlpA-like double-psi beta-barrel-protein domain-containing protein-containing protein n=1 Tax=Leucosporidium creatinivorum TaxID=106004 RepID=A0A1Y2FJM6_9BASI|nr:hypothetical protein BCR35DRAFT_351924 [Leucosporidium creatinivorum]
MHLATSTTLLAALIALPAAFAAPTGPVATGLAHIVQLPDDSTAFSNATAGSLEKRAISCTKTVDCSGLTGVPYAAHTYCNPSTKTCTWLCNSGYTKSAGKCVKNVGTPAQASATVPPTTTVKTTTKTTTTTRATATDWFVNAEIAKKGITGFKAATLGVNTNAIASWFHTNSATDSTNGNSWCLYPYDDTVPGMAISLAQMRANYGGNDDLAREAYCGLEAIVTTPDGRTASLVVVDAFDDAWVRTPSSIDVVYGSFPKLFGGVTNDKNDVVVGASWKFTGRRNYKYRARGRGSSK